MKMVSTSRSCYPCNGGLLFLSLLLVTAVVTSSSSLAVAENSNSTYRGSSGRYCSGSIGECQDDDAEWLMESGTGRSLLQSGRITNRAVSNANQPAAGNGARGGSYNRGCNAGAYRCNTGNY